MKMCIAILSLLACVATVSAQTVATSSQPVRQVVSTPKTDLLSSFSKLEINGPMRVTLKAAATAEEVKIVYDTKGDLTSKFKAEIDKNGVLRISEREDPKRLSVTEVTLYHPELTAVKIVRAQATFSSRITTNIFDLYVSSGAIVSMDIEALDVYVSCTGKSSLMLKGATRYLTMDISTATVEADELKAVSTIVEASHNADVRVFANERIEATTATSAKLLYKGKPSIVRTHTQLFGGDIVSVD